MAEEAERRWLVDPPAAGQVSVIVALGEGVELNDVQRAALDELLASLQQADEVSGFAGACDITKCEPREITTPCAWLVGTCPSFESCRITPDIKFY